MKNTVLPPIADVIYVDDLEAYINRKFYMINMAHAATAYVGFRAGEKTIQSTLADPKMREFIKSVLNEVKKYIVIDSHFSAEELDAYIEKTISRFKNENISDDVRRVGRAPIRKLGSDERLVKPLRNLFELDLPLESLTIVIAAAFRFDNSEDEEAVRLQKYIQEKGIEQAIPHFTGIEEEELINKIEKYYLKLENTVTRHKIQQ